MVFIKPSLCFLLLKPSVKGPLTNLPFGAGLFKDMIRNPIY
ncbi:hypothetical protein ADICYQ_2083 [Cyclobacterium qasimii M12-11B]|uniref:Uncharacterized protein n=1 Tax=Cyclobacterium qasimii M12-11B TaxID=641524 RepID=S7VGR4_9BACT|nr:hypothetical protein ADICYQ_2083 [Cyclobacterium qasimii M12-11B]